MSEEQIVSEEDLTQSSYVPSGYAPNQWEVIGKLSDHTDFVPMEVPVLDQGQLSVDPMFNDYGGISKDDSGKRWHVSDDISYKAQLNARKEADAIMQKSKTMLLDEIEALENENFEAGKKAGREEAEVLAKAKLEELQGRFGTLLQDMAAQQLEINSDFEKRCVQLSLEISKRILETAVEINPEYITELVKEAIANSGSAVIKKIRVSPADLEFIEYAGLKEKVREFAGTWNFEADQTLKSGCVVETSAGQIDYQLDQAWERLKANVVRVVR